MTSLGEPIGIASASRYRFVEHIASGGMAEIYAADVMGVAGVSRRVAVKRVLREYVDDEAFLAMFTNEARLSVRLQHPNIVQTYDVLDAHGELYITMELLEGLSLLDLLRLLDGPDPALTIAQSVYIIERVLAGLHYAHERLGPDGEPLGIVHRDVSPHNIYLTLDGNVKLLDFGVAKMSAKENDTNSGVVKGKVLYMAPEHCQGGAVDRRADVFSVGVLLQTLLTNRHPFKGKNPYDTMRAVIHDPAPRPTSLREDLPEAFDVILAKALEKNPDDRYPTAQAMQEDLAKAIRANGLFTTDTEFGRFIQNEMPTIDRSIDPNSLPPDLVFGTVPEVHTGRHPAANAALAETSHATVERVFGVTLLQLRGILNESFDPEPLVEHLRGTLVVDTSGVQAITSYGLRGLLSLYEGMQTDAVYHIRASVALLQQVSMVQMLLGGGKVVSFYLPYVDPVNGNAFTVLLDGARAQKVLETGDPPPWTCPGYPSRDASFDEDPETYFGFLDDFLEEPDPEVKAVLDGLAQEHRRRQVEKAVDADGTRIWIRRPLQATFRWRNLLDGLEGEVHVDMEDTPSWTEAGIEALVKALREECDAITALKVTHAPKPLVLALFRTGLGDLLVQSTGRVHARCDDTGVPRRVALDLAVLETVRIGSDVGQCPSSGGRLLSMEDFSELGSNTKEPPSEPETPASPVVERPQPVRSPSTSSPPLLIWALLALGLLSLLMGSWLSWS